MSVLRKHCPGLMSGQFSTGLMYGLINSVMLIPICISFCSIIFRNPAFNSYIPQLVKLVLFSSMVHQMAFTWFSSLPFAIGQVQDAGLIFLSAMAGSIADGAEDKEFIVPTTLVVLGFCTFALGGMLMVVAKLKLASTVQYLPMPVIGGYLAFIGFFCGQAGLAMMAGVTVENIFHWGNFLTFDAIYLLTPGLICGVSMYFLLRNVESPYVLPCCMLGVLVIFYLGLLVTGSSIEDARESGWIAPSSEIKPFYYSWELFDFNKVDWREIPNQFFRLIGMFLVVAFSSSLDVAAIEMELGLPLDYNRELYTVGISNLTSGILGGYTGSYIFSQTIFTMRRGIHSRICGYTVVFCELIIIVLPISITSFVPKLFFGSLLVLIAVDLMYEWLIAARDKMTSLEYMVCVSTFFLIQFLGIEAGMLVGILCAMLTFVVTYAKLQTVSVASLQTSTVVRTFEERAVLIANRGKVVTISLRGFIFFGSAVNILQDVKNNVMITNGPPGETPATPKQPSTGDSEFARQKKEYLEHQLSVQSPPDQIPPHPYASPHRTYVTLSEASTVSQHAVGSTLEPAYYQQQEEAKVTSPLGAPRFSFRVPLTPKPSRNSRVVKKDTRSSPSSNPSNSVPSSGWPNIWGVITGSGTQQIPDNEEEIPLVQSHSLDSLEVGKKSVSGSLNTPIPASTLTQLAGTTPGSGGEPAASTTSGKSPVFATFGSVYDMSDEEIQRHHSMWMQGGGSWSNDGVGRLKFLARANSTHHEKAKEVEGADVAVDVEKGVVSFKPVSGGEAQGLIGDEEKKGYGATTGSPQSPAMKSSLKSSLLSQSLEKAATAAEQTNANTELNVRNTGVSNPLTLQKENSADSLFASVWNQQSARRQKIKQSNSHSSLSGIAAKKRQMSDETLSLKAGETNGLKSQSSDSSLRKHDSGYAHDLTIIEGDGETERGAAGEPEEEESVEEVMTEYLVLDFTRVLGVDATAARSCFLMLVRLMQAAQVTVVFASMSSSVEQLLRAHGVVREGDVVIPQLDDALEWCEEEVLYSARQLAMDDNSYHSDYSWGHLSRHNSNSVLENKTHGTNDTNNAMASLISDPVGADASKGLNRDPNYYAKRWHQRQQHAGTALRSGRGGTRTPQRNSSRLRLLSSPSVGTLEETPRLTEGRALRRILEDYLEVDASSHLQIHQLLDPKLLIQYFTRVALDSGEIVFDVDEPSDSIYFIEQGVVEVVTISPIQDQNGDFFTPSGTSQQPIADEPNVRRINKVSVGGAFGESDFFLGRSHSVRVYTMADSIFWTLDRENYAKMELENPKLCMLIQHSLLKSLAISATCAIYALYPSAHGNE